MPEVPESLTLVSQRGKPRMGTAIASGSVPRSDRLARTHQCFLETEMTLALGTLDRHVTICGTSGVLPVRSRRSSCFFRSLPGRLGLAPA